MDRPGDPIGTAIGHYAPDFELPGTDGDVHHLGRYLQRYRGVGIVVMANHCPYVRLYLDRLKQLQSDFQPQGVTLVGLNANDEQQLPEDSFENMKRFASQQQLNFPYLRDVTQEVVQSLGATCTPEIFLVDQQGVLRYRGAIDNSPQNPAAVTLPYLQDAISQLLAGDAIAIATAEATGCSVKWRM